jgi:hypothetical protein
LDYQFDSRPADRTAPVGYRRRIVDSAPQSFWGRWMAHQGHWAERSPPPAPTNGEAAAGLQMADLGFPRRLLRRHTSIVAAAISTGFVGRSDELGRLLIALERAEQGRPVMVLVAGDAGIGKTRLLAALADRARQRGDQVLVGGCLEVGDVGLPYLPLLDAFHDLTSSGGAPELLIDAVRSAPGLGRLLPEVAKAGSIAVDWEAGLEQLQMFDGVRRLLARLGERSPVLLILEDLHWADQSTGDLLAFLARALRTGRVMVVGSYRSDGLPRRHPLRPLLVELFRLPGLERIELGPLSRAELATHLNAVSGYRYRRSGLSISLSDRKAIRSTLSNCWQLV